MSSAVKSKKRARPSEGSSIAAEIELALSRKKALDAELLNLERQIYALETSYLENTAQLGDLIRGWGDFSAPMSPGGPGGSTMTKKKKKINDHERIFSSSSVSAMKNPEFHGLGATLHTSSMGSGAGSRQHHAAAHVSSMDDEPDDFSTSLTFDMDVDSTPTRQKGHKKASDPASSTKKSRAPASRATPKPTKQPSSLLSEQDSLGLGFNGHDEFFGH
jgi:hypothetical protein